MAPPRLAPASLRYDDALSSYASLMRKRGGSMECKLQLPELPDEGRRDEEAKIAMLFPHAYPSSRESSARNTSGSGRAASTPADHPPPSPKARERPAIQLTPSAIFAPGFAFNRGAPYSHPTYPKTCHSRILERSNFKARVPRCLRHIETKARLECGIPLTRHSLVPRSQRISLTPSLLLSGSGAAYRENPLRLRDFGVFARCSSGAFSPASGDWDVCTQNCVAPSAVAGKWGSRDAHQRRRCCPCYAIRNPPYPSRCSSTRDIPQHPPAPSLPILSPCPSANSRMSSGRSEWG
ncbi:hypothetical protein R3P38DRAFT_3257744 [Favolaschia claudopus]|uniref:Uncharacterized protein n=1 Tax=Favolaschia claudopus TaxID=2862362 RepID=A0AAW0D690_9AGAR